MGQCLKKSIFIRKIFSTVLIFLFTSNLVLPPSYAQSIAQSLNLPTPGTLLSPTAAFTPALIQGITIDVNNPLKMDFIVDVGDQEFQGNELEVESMKLVKYFLSSLTIPENELWVNLSPYEKNRVISEEFSKTEMGRDMLAQDYVLKQLSASLTYPEEKLGQEFWQRVQSKAKEKFGSAEIPMNTFNKVWIIPEKAVVLEHENTAYVIESHLKVMLEEDYLALKENMNNASLGLNKVQDKAEIISGVSSQVIREIVIPEIEKEVNENENFANIRQIYNSMILATWYKKNLRESLLGQVYVDQNKTKGIDTNNPAVNEEIYKQYVEAFKKGAYNYIKEDYDAQAQETIPQKYFSGGFNYAMMSLKLEEVDVDDLNRLTPTQLAGVQSVVRIAGGKFRVTIALLENAASGDPQKAALPKATVIAQRVATVRGAQTGEIFIEDAVKAGATGIIAGHSEARKNLGDKHETINAQLKAADTLRLKTIIHCIGETGEERSGGKTESVLSEQLQEELKGRTPEQVAATVIAYEPRWAIKGPDFVRKCEPEDAQDAVHFIRQRLEAMYSAEVARKVRIIFGGSVDKDNAWSYLSLPDVDGALPGTASIDVEGLEGILAAADGVGAKEGRKPFVAGNWKTMDPKNDSSAFARMLSGVDPARLEVALAPTATQIKAVATAIAKVEIDAARVKTANAPKPKIRTGFQKPAGQPKDFFTNVYSIFSLDGVLSDTLVSIPDEVVDAIRAKLAEDAAAGKIRSARVNDYGGNSVDIHVTHDYGELNASVHKVMLEAMRAGLEKAQGLGLLKSDVDPTAMSLQNLIKDLRVATNEHSIVERKAESVVIARLVGATPSAANIKLFHEFAVAGSTPLQKLGLPNAPGFRFRVRRTEDIRNGNLDGNEWEFEISAAHTTKDGVHVPSVNQSIELLALAGQPNDYQITAVYPVEGGALNPNEPIATVVYQPIEGMGNSRLTNTAIIYRSQSGADAVGGVASIVYDVNMVTGGHNGEYFVATNPVSLQNARKQPQAGMANVSVVAYQSRRGGEIPMEAIVDHVGVNEPAVQAQQKIAATLADIFQRHGFDQPNLAPWASEEHVAGLRAEQDQFYLPAPKDNEADPMFAEVERKVKTGELVVATHEKADMGGIAGHTQVPPFMEAIYRASLQEYVEQGKLLRGDTVNVGDDGHMLLIGDKSDHGNEGHQLAFRAFTRAYLFSSANGIKPYGEGQDYQGPEAQAAKKNPYFYSGFTDRFFELVRGEMHKLYPGQAKFADSMVDTVLAGWGKWQTTGQSTTELADPFSGNVSQQGIGYARYPIDIAGGETTFDVIAGDKMGPSAFNRMLKWTVFNAVDAGEFSEGLVFEVWDAKAWDADGNIPFQDLPGSYEDIKYQFKLTADALKKLSPKKQAAYAEAKKFVDDVAYAGHQQLSATLDDAQKRQLSAYLKAWGYVPTKRIFLDANADRDAIVKYLADSDRFNVKHVWSKKQAGWDISNPQAYLDRPMLGSSITRLGILTGGEYVGKDDPVMVGNTRLLKFAHEFLRTEPLIIQGDMNGSHWLWAIPSAREKAVATTDSHPIFVQLRRHLSSDGSEITQTDDIAGQADFDAIRSEAFDFNWRFKKAQLGGQHAPYGTDWRTVEASYDLAKILAILGAADSPFLVKNKKAVGDVRAWPAVPAEQLQELYAAVTSNRAMIARTEIALGTPATLDVVPPGGIDLHSKYLNLQVKRDSQGIPLPMPQQPVYNMHIDGFLPMMLEIAPVTVSPLSRLYKEKAGEKLSYNSN